MQVRYEDPFKRAEADLGFHHLKLCSLAAVEEEQLLVPPQTDGRQISREGWKCPA
jgi:hypothetical protein